MKLKEFINPVLGIAAEILYALCIMLMGYLISAAFSYSQAPWF